MTYSAEISRSKPTCFVFLIDQSGSMADPIMGRKGNPEKAAFIADSINRILRILVTMSSKDDGIRDYFDIAAIGYGSHIGSILDFIDPAKKVFPISAIANSPKRIEDRKIKESDGAGGVIEVNTKFPIWIETISEGGTPMRQGLEMAHEILVDWVATHPDSYPPTIINLSDGEATDGNPLDIAQQIKGLSTNDGEVIFFSIHVSSHSHSTPIKYPSSEEELPDDPSKLMFKMSSPLTPNMLADAGEKALDTSDGAKCMVYHGDIEDVINALEIGTRPANLR